MLRLIFFLFFFVTVSTLLVARNTRRSTHSIFFSGSSHVQGRYVERKDCNGVEKKRKETSRKGRRTLRSTCTASISSTKLRNRHFLLLFFSLYTSSSILLYPRSIPKSFLGGNYLVLGRNPKKDDSVEKYFKPSNPLSGSTRRVNCWKLDNPFNKLDPFVTFINMYKHGHTRKRVLFVNNNT